MEAEETEPSFETGTQQEPIDNVETDAGLNEEDEPAMDVTTNDQEPSATTLPSVEDNEAVTEDKNESQKTEPNDDKGMDDSTGDKVVSSETMEEPEAKPDNPTDEDAANNPITTDNNNMDTTTPNSSQRLPREHPTPPSSKSPPKKSSPTGRTKLPPINSSSTPLKLPTLGIGDNVYHPAHTPRRQLRPFGMRQNNLSSFSSSQQVDTQQQQFQPDITNSLSGQQSQRYEDSITDSGFSSQVVNNPPPMFLQQYDDDDEDEQQFEGVPVPYQSQKFKSSTVMRMVTVPRRNQDMFGKERNHNKNRGMAFHTGRYNYLETVTDKFDRSPSQLSQRDRLLLETAHLEKLRDIRRELGTSAPHRLSLNLAMGGSKVEFFDRVDIPAELRELKNISLPIHARDLYVGRGIALPEGHALNKPRRLRPLN